MSKSRRAPRTPASAGRALFPADTRVRLSTGNQTFRVIETWWSRGHERWMVHGKAGPAHFWKFQEDVRNA